MKAITAALLLSLAAGSQAQAPATPPPAPSPFTFALKGFVGASGYYQDAVFGLSEGMQAIYVVPFSGTNGPLKDTRALGFDVRQSRFNFSVKGPQVFAGATPMAVLEIDFFQGFGAGSFGDASLLNRLRLAYAELNWGANRIAFGQQNDLVFAMAPVSLPHIAFPLGYGTGNIGWRRPGIWGFHTAAMQDMKVEFAWEVARSTWADGGAGGGAPTSGIGANTVNAPGTENLGEASGLPAVEARLTLTSGTALSAFVAGHWNRVDWNGVGTEGGRNLDVMAGNAGFKAVAGPLTLQGTGFIGKNTGPLLGNIVQFQGGSATATAAPTVANPRDVKAWGFWGQAGFNLTPELSVWGLYGRQNVMDKADARLSGFTRLRNWTTDATIQYRDGGYGIAFDWIHMATNTTIPDTNTAKDLRGNQYMLTGLYFF